MWSWFGKDTVLKGWLKAGRGSNTRAELVGLWSLHFCAKLWGVSALQILGIPKLLLFGLKGAQVKSLDLHHWMESMKCLMKDFSFFIFPTYL